MASKSQLDHDKNGKAGGSKPKAFSQACGMNEVGIDAFLYDAEQLDKGTSRFPWPKGLKGKIKDAIDGMTFMPAVKGRVNDLVVKEAGPGLLNRGPFDSKEVA
jgi:hypothetical protein